MNPEGLEKILETFYDYENEWADDLDPYGMFCSGNSLAGDLVKLKSWTKHPNRLGQIIKVESDDSVEILVDGLIKEFLMIDYDLVRRS